MQAYSVFLIILSTLFWAYLLTPITFRSAGLLMFIGILTVLFSIPMSVVLGYDYVDALLLKHPVIGIWYLLGIGYPFVLLFLYVLLRTPFKWLSKTIHQRKTG